MAPRTDPKAKAAAIKAKAKPSELERLIAREKKIAKELAKAKAENAKLVAAKRNADMIEQEEAENSSRPTKKAKASSTAPSSDLDDDEEGLDGLLGPNPAGNEDVASNAGSNGGRTSPITSSIDDEEDEAADSDLPVFNDSDMIVDEVTGPTKKQHRRKGSRVTQSTFSPTSAHLANVGRFAVRVKVATKDGFPPNHAEFAWDALSGAVPEGSELAGRLTQAEDSAERRSQLINYAWGGAAQVRGELKSVCKGMVALYGIPGDYTPEQIVKKIKWLTGRKGVFKFGGIDMETETYDVQQPFGAAFYQEVMRKQWFDSLKSEGVRTASFEHFIDSPVPTVTLVTGAMENSLQEWATGVRIQIKFTEEAFAPRYQHHRAALLSLQAKSPTWFAKFQRDLYVKIVSHSNFPHLKRIVAEPGEDQLDGVDFDALEAEALAENSSETATNAVEPAAAATASTIA